jgi:hypothetical protein
MSSISLSSPTTFSKFHSLYLILHIFNNHINKNGCIIFLTGLNYTDYKLWYTYEYFCNQSFFNIHLQVANRVLCTQNNFFKKIVLPNISTTSPLHGRSTRDAQAQLEASESAGENG